MQPDTDTESEDDELQYDEEYQALVATTSSDPRAHAETGDELCEAYLQAKRLRHNFSGRRTRRQRFTNRRRHVLLPTLKERNKASNPIGSDGQPMKCSPCGSEWHLRRWCPQTHKGGGGKYKGRSSGSPGVLYSGYSPEGLSSMPPTI
eukprot:8843593-Prorocentrum_lima.AAC.1